MFSRSHASVWERDLFFYHEGHEEHEEKDFTRFMFFMMIHKAVSASNAPAWEPFDVHLFKLSSPKKKSKP
jgi:hypothetical protein